MNGARKEGAAIRVHQRDCFGKIKVRKVLQRNSVHHVAALMTPKKACQAAKERRFPRAVPSQKGNSFSGLERKVQIGEDVFRSVAEAEGISREDGRCAVGRAHVLLSK